MTRIHRVDENPHVEDTMTGDTAATITSMTPTVTEDLSLNLLKMNAATRIIVTTGVTVMIVQADLAVDIKEEARTTSQAFLLRAIPVATILILRITLVSFASYSWCNTLYTMP
ncbi:hypothetical protein OESDEN_23858 [Oesophagostomum dentatum]|uniref:Uncharacterized protein n=1 Tax=Oesophagostomum dentatum TaxID=61180 RepID=A0A0B1RZ71_OESDE|nr:hypothetical protein OESDEN_23858 [Oesophagostomum dentatum]